MTPRILFYIQRNLQLPFLEPVQQQLVRLCPEVITAFCAPPFIAPQNGLPGWGLEQHEVERLKGKACFVRTVEEFHPDVTIFADACTNIFNCGKRVFVGHGIISKGGFYTDNQLVRRENLADLICVPGPWHKEILRKNVFSPIKVTGFIKADRLFGPAACTRADFCIRYAIPLDATIILYAPTFNEELSAIPCIGEQIAQVCEPDRYLVIKLHTMTDTVLLEMHRRLAAGHPRIRFVEEIDVTPAMAAADLLISDVSSVLVEFMALDRPVIAVNNPRQREYEGYQPDDIEYRVRDACLQVDNADELLRAVDRAIRFPEELAPLRRKYADALCFGRDGRAAERTAEAVLALLRGDLPAAAPAEAYTLLLMVKPTDTVASVLHDLGHLAISQPGIQLDIFVCGMACPAGYDIPLVKGWFAADVDPCAALQDVAAKGAASWLVLLESGLLLPRHALRFLANYFRWNRNLAMARTVTVRDDYRFLLKTIYPEINNPPLEMVSDLLIAVLMGRSVPMEHAAPGCCMLRREAVAGLKLFRPDEKDLCTEQLRQAFNTAGKAAELALDLFVRPAPPISSSTAMLAEAVDTYLQQPADTALLNRLLALLVACNCHKDAQMLLSKHGGEADGLRKVWGFLLRFGG